MEEIEQFTGFPRFMFLDTAKRQSHSCSRVFRSLEHTLLSALPQRGDL